MPKIKLVIMRLEHAVPFNYTYAAFHYPDMCEGAEATFEMMGHKIVEVHGPKAEELLKGLGQGMLAQIGVERLWNKEQEK